MKLRIANLFSPLSRIAAVIFVFAFSALLLSQGSYAAADFINDYISQPFRMIMAQMGDVFSFSLFEVVVLCIPVFIAIVIVKTVCHINDREAMGRLVVNLAAIVLLIYSGHLIALGIAHNTTPLSRKMSLEEVDVTEDRLVTALIDVRDEINALASDVSRDDSGVFVHGYSYSQVSEKICEYYNSFASEYDLPKGYSSNAKGVRAGEVMSYLGISGIYTYVTGEANVNTLYPDYVTLFTTAHEKSHQRGILRENEANFVAYILLSSSDDSAFRYSAALNIYSYLASALYRTNKDAYNEIVSELSPLAKIDIRTANSITQKYGDTIISDISEWINDLYLESSGSGGVVSYSQVVTLVLAYRESQR